MTSEARGRTRRTAEERRADVLDAALTEFSTYGLHGASTVNIAERAGISQPYVLRLFGTKLELFHETVHMAKGLIVLAWQRSLEEMPAEATPAERLEALGHAFRQLSTRTEVLRLLLQAYSAAADDEVRARCQAAMRELYGWVRGSTGASPAEARIFFANGMLIMVGVSIGAPDLVEEEWARAFLLADIDDA